MKKFVEIGRGKTEGEEEEEYDEDEDPRPRDKGKVISSTCSCWNSKLKST